MANQIKYSTGSETLALKKGNFYIGTGDVGKGPTSSTGYYSGIEPPSGGYTIYLNKASGGPSIYTCTNDTQLISLTNKIAGASYTTANQCLVYFAGQTDKMVLNRNYESIITNGLVLNVDAGFTPSYPRSGTTWYDVDSTNNAELINGPTFDSNNSGAIVFDGSDDRGSFNNYYPTFIGDFTINIWFNLSTYINYQNVISSANDGNATQGFWLEFGSARGFTMYNTGTQLVVEDNLVSLTSLSTNVWHNVCITRLGTGTNNVKLYVDNILCGERSYNNTVGHASQNLEIARYAKNSESLRFQGKISTIQIYNGVGFTPTQVLQSYKTIKGRFGL
jgi:hypothetical protein